MFESINIAYQALSILCGTATVLPVAAAARARTHDGFREDAVWHTIQPQKTKMEAVLLRYKNLTRGELRGCGMSFGAVEAGKGLFGVFIAACDKTRPYRVFLRSPAYNHLQLLRVLCPGHLLADVVTLLGTFDIVFGEVDR